MSTSDQEGEKNCIIGAQNNNVALVGQSKGQSNALIVWKGANISHKGWVCGDLLGDSRHSDNAHERRVLEQRSSIRYGVHLLDLAT